jgi:hypothetical protein
MLQATVCNGSKLDAFAFCEDRLRSAEVDVSRRDVVDALMIADVIVVLDEGGDLRFEIARQVIVLEQNAVLQSLVPAFDLSLSLGGGPQGRHRRRSPQCTLGTSLGRKWSESPVLRQNFMAALGISDDK